MTHIITPEIYSEYGRPEKSYHNSNLAFGHIKPIKQKQEKIVPTFQIPDTQ